MSELLHEQLSALIDGELPAAETALLLKRLEREPALRERLARYHACGATLRGGRVGVRTDFSLKLSAVLEAEPCHATSAPRAAARALSLGRYLKPLAGLAVAAAVAGIAILVLGRPGTPAPPAAELARLAPPRPTAAAATPAPSPRAVTPPMLAAAPALGTEPASYVTPAAHPELGVISRGELANYALAHSGVVGSFGVHSVYTSLVSDDDSGGTPAR
jgi:sigma-E factor negative regulatory protein RseA